MPYLPPLRKYGEEKLADNQKFRFISKPSAKGGKLSVVLSAASAAFMVAAIIISSVKGGEAGTVTGGIGFCGTLLAAVAFVLGIRGLGEKNVSHKLSFIGSVAGGLAAILWLAVFFVGIK